MSSDTVISVENLSKSYLIGHEGPREKYHSLRDTVVRHGKNYARKAFDMARGRQIIQGDSVEEFRALKDVSFEVKRGEVLGIIGRNGAGKSTLLKILSRITEPSSGRIELNGRVASLLEVGTGFHPELTGRENIFLNGAILGMTKSEIRSKFDEIVAFAEVERFLDTPVKRYSSGMYVRLAFAVAAHLEPEILIVDEVLAVGDAEFQKKCLGKIKDVAGHGRTVLFVSHNMMAVGTLCSNGLMLERGKVKMAGNANECIDAYSSGANSIGAAWSRPDPQPDSCLLSFKTASLVLEGDPGNYILNIACSTLTHYRHPPAFVAVDILNSMGTCIMQALPRVDGFIGDEKKCQDLLVKIMLPPLVPGVYTVNLWVGPHNATTYDQVNSVLAFHITESPTKGRTFAHSPELGAIVPISTIEYL